MILLLLLAVRRWRPLAMGWMLALLLAEVLLLNTTFALNGAASNPFTVVLLVPVALAYMLLPWWPAMTVLITSICAQLLQLLLLHRGEHQAMLHHYYGMVFGLVFTSIMIAVVVAYFRQQLQRQEAAISQMRERQLRNEQLLAIGTAAAQLTHDVATPMQSIHLLLEEVQELAPATSNSTTQVIEEISREFQRIEQQLAQWRAIANEVREQRSAQLSVAELCRSLQQLMRMMRPEARIEWQMGTQNMQDTARVIADGTLLPALTNLVINAYEAAQRSGENRVQVESQIDAQQWQIRIINATLPLSTTTLQRLGLELVTSASGGHGMGAVLSNATIEKLAGSVHWQQQQNRVTTIIRLPVLNDGVNDE